MNKLKKILKISGIVLATLLLILILIPFLFKGKILNIAKEQANQNLNAVVNFSDLSISMIRSFPSLNVKLMDISVVGKQEFEKDTLASMKFISLNLNLWSVIAGDEIKINSILLQEPSINVRVLRNGKANYDITLPDSTTTEEEETDSSSTPLKLALKKFEIRKAKITYNDHESDMTAIIDNINLSLKGDMADDITDLEFLLTLDYLTVIMEGIPYLSKAKLSFDSEIEADLVNFKFTFKENLFQINEIALAFDGYVTMPEEDIDMDLKFATSKTEFKSLLSMIPAVYQTDFEGIETTGSLKLDGWAKGIFNDYRIPAFGVNLLVENAYFKYPDLPSAVENINIDVKVTNPGNTDINEVEINKFHLEMAENPVDAKMIIKTTAEDVFLDGKIDAKVNLAKVKDFYPLEDMTLSGLIAANLSFKGNLSDVENESFESFQADGNLEVSNMITEMVDMPAINIENTKLIFTKNYANLNNFDAKIGKSDLHLSGQINNIFEYVFNDKLLTANFDFNSSLFDANEFLSDEEEIPDSISTEEEVTTAFEIPANIDFTLNSKIDKVLFENLEITNIVGIIKMKESMLILEKLLLNALKGSVLLSAKYDSKDIQNPKAEFTMDISKIDIQETFLSFVTIQKLAPIFKSCEGELSTKLELATTMDYYLNPVMNTINASGSVVSDNIGVQNNKFFSILANFTKEPKYEKPTLKDINLMFVIKDGNLEIKPTNFKLVGTVASIEGFLNLDQTINFQLGMMLPKAIAGDLIENFFPEKPDVMIYATIGGTVTDPKIIKVNTSLTDVVKEEVKEFLSDKAKAILAAAKEKADKLVAEAKAAKEKLVAEAKTKSDALKAAADKEAQALLDKAKKEGDELISKANNPIAKKAAEKAAEELMKTAKTKVDKIVAEAKTGADKLVTAANTQGDKLVSEAQTKADKIMQDAQKEVDSL